MHPSGLFGLKGRFVDSRQSPQVPPIHIQRRLRDVDRHVERSMKHACTADVVTVLMGTSLGDLTP